MNAIKTGDINTLQEYITQADQTQLNERDDEGNTLLHIAVKHLCESYEFTQSIPDGVIDVILLLAKHVNRRLRNGDEKLVIHLIWECEAALYEESMIPVLEELLTEEYIQEECYVEGRCILHEAAQAQKWDVVRALVKKGVDITKLDDGWNTALSYVADAFDVPDDIVEKLSHPDVMNRHDDCGDTPLMRAATKNNNEMIKQLIRNGADITVKVNSSTALNIAMLENAQLSVEALRTLIHPSIVNNQKNTSEIALHDAASWGNVTAIDELLKAGSDINVRAFFGHKPIDNYACNSPLIEAAVVEKLLPNDGEDYTDALIATVQKWFFQPPPNVDDAIDTISMFLLRSGRDDFFTTNRLSLEGNGTLQLSLYNNLQYNVDLCDVYGLSILVRKGMGCRTPPHLSGTISADRNPSSIELQRYERTEALWNHPNSLSELCCFTIRDTMNNPSKHKINELGLPKEIADLAMFRNVAREFCETLSDVSK